MDEDLRALERAAGQDPAACLRYANALERAGRKDDAFPVLCAMKQHPAVRAALARWPAWTHPWGGPGGTYWLDVKPVRREPRVRWRVELAAAVNPVASPFGIAAISVDELVVLDPDDSQVRWSAPAPGPPYLTHAVLRGDLVASVAISESATIVRELDTGLEVARLEGHAMFVHEDLVLVKDSFGHACAFAWPYARGPSSPEPAWRSQGMMSVRAGGDLLVVHGEHDFVILDRRTGRLLLRAPGVGESPMVDQHGALIQGDHLHGIAPDGRIQFELAPSQSALPSVLAPTYFGVARDDAVDIHDRSDGRWQRTLSRGGGAEPCAAAREVLYLPSGRPDGEDSAVHAVTCEGKALWTLPLDRGDLVGDLVPYPGRLYVLTTDGSLLCLEEPPAEG